MIFTPSDTVSLTLFSLFSLIMLSSCFYVLIKNQIHNKWKVIYLLLILIPSTLALSGAMAQWTIPLLPLFMATIFIFGISFSLSSAGKKLAATLPLVVLVGFQGFRLPLELILHKWADLGTVPKTMTWTGSNWDIAAGIMALLSIPFIKKNEKLGYVVNFVGFILLMNVLRVVILSSPFPFSWPLESPLQLALYFPYILIVPLFVLPAFIGHLVVFQKMRGK